MRWTEALSCRAMLLKNISGTAPTQVPTPSAKTGSNTWRPSTYPGSRAAHLLATLVYTPAQGPAFLHHHRQLAADVHSDDRTTAVAFAFSFLLLLYLRRISSKGTRFCTASSLSCTVLSVPFLHTIRGQRDLRFQQQPAPAAAADL